MIMVKENNQTPCYLLIYIVQYNPQQEFVITLLLQLITYLLIKVKNENYILCPFINELSDHDVQIITIHITTQNQISYIQTIR